MPIDSWANFDTIATTTSILDEGLYEYKVELRQSSWTSTILNFFGLTNLFSPGVIDSFQGNFIVGSPSDLEQYYLDIASSTEGFLNNAPSFADSLDSCNPISGWDTGECIFGLFVPSQLQLNYAWGQFYDLFLKKAPLGYFSRFIEILSDNATTTIPSLTIDFKEGSSWGGDIELSLQNALEEASSILGDVNTDNEIFQVDEPEYFWDVVMPKFTILAYLLLFFLIIKDITGLQILNGFGSRGSLSDNSSTDDSYRLKETLYNMSKRKK